MTQEQTTPIELDNSLLLPAQSLAGTWSFGSTQAKFIGGLTERTEDEPLTKAQQLHELTLPPQKMEPPTFHAAITTTHAFGRRMMRADREWEGVVERIEGDEFHCRLRSMGTGQSGADYELTSFSFDELSSESDRDFISPGAVLYWSVGRATNEFGTHSNLSLIRVRRSIGLSLDEKKKANVEAMALFSALAGDE